MKMHITNIVSQIPEDTADEALLSIESITTNPGGNSARLRCHLANEFRIFLKAQKDGVAISAEGRPTITVAQSDFLAALKMEIYAIDELMSAGLYTQAPPKKNIIMPLPPAPEDFDIPVWDEKTQSWYDAEY